MKTFKVKKVEGYNNESDNSGRGLTYKNLKSDFWVVMLVLVFFTASGLAAYFWAQYDQIDSAIPLQTDKIGDLTSPERTYFPNAMSCVAIKGQLNHCTKEAFQKQNEFIKTKRNLVAQEGMWSSSTKLLKLTIFQLWLFFISSAISIYAIFLVKKTLDATNKANINANLAVEAAQEANRIATENSKDVRNLNTLQLQPWISLGEVNVRQDYLSMLKHSIPETERNRQDFKGEVQFINKGKTPVKHAVVEILTFGVSDFLDNAISLDSEVIKIEIAKPINPEEDYKAKFSKPFKIIFKDSSDKFSDGSLSFDIEGKLRFKDISTSHVNHRCISFEIHGTNEEQHTTINSEEICFDNEYFLWIK